jgi:hypothetical protein
MMICALWGKRLKRQNGPPTTEPLGVGRRSRFNQTIIQKKVVRAVGIEPTLLSEPDFESGASTSSTTPATALLLAHSRENAKGKFAFQTPKAATMKRAHLFPDADGDPAMPVSGGRASRIAGRTGRRALLCRA